MHKLNPRLQELLANPNNHQKLQEILDLAIMLVGEFDDYGEVLQSNADGVYDHTTTIEQLRGAIIRFDYGMLKSSDYLGQLSDAQHKRLSQLAVEVICAGDGENTVDEDVATSDVGTMTPAERLIATGYWDVNDARREDLRKRLGFNPSTGESIWQG